MKIEGGDVTAGFHMPEPLFMRMEKARVKSMQLNKQDISQSEYIRESIYHFFDYLLDLEEDEIIEILINEKMPYEKSKKKLINFVTKKGITDVVGEIMGRVSKIAGTHKNSKRHTKASFYIKAFTWYIDRVDKVKTDKAINAVIKEKKSGQSK